MTGAFDAPSTRAGRRVTFDTAGLRLTLAVAGDGTGLTLAGLTLADGDAPLLPPASHAELAEMVIGTLPRDDASPLVQASVLGTPRAPAPAGVPGVPASTLHVERIEEQSSGAQRPLFVQLAAGTSGLRLRLVFEEGPHGVARCRILARLAGETTPVDCTLRLPFVRALHPAYPTAPVIQLPEGPRAAHGRPVVRHGEFPLPYCVWTDDAHGRGIAVMARQAASTQVLPAWVPAPLGGVHVRLRDGEWLDCIEVSLVPFTGGWRGAFTAFRDQIRARVDLPEYARPDLAWYRGQWVQHFTYAYSREVFDFEREAFDLDRLLDEGQRDFGGYDGVLFWPQYPRIGLDQRSQWDVYDDVPGGRPGLGAMARRARDRGTRFFIPYLPWDDPPDERRTHHNPPAERLAQVVRDCDVDGVFLDTMSGVVPRFRSAIDAQRPGVVFCSEGRPRGESIGLITGSWAQDPLGEALEVDLLRFLFPEHPTFVIFRHAVRETRRCTLLRALFNGTGIVVWQDVFGEVLEFTPDERALVKRIADVLRRHASVFRGSDGLPLVPALQEGLYANYFVSAEGNRALSVWNNTPAPIEGDLILMPGISGAGEAGEAIFEDVWNGGTCRVERDGSARTVLRGRVPQEVSILVETAGGTRGEGGGLAPER